MCVYVGEHIALMESKNNFLPNVVDKLFCLFELFTSVNSVMFQVS